MEYNIAKEFSRTPSARTEKEGKNPGESLRKIVAPKLRECITKNEKFQIILDGTAGYGTSFLEEVFGGLIREEGLNYNDIKNTLIIVSDEEPDLIDEIWLDIEDANKNE